MTIKELDKLRQQYERARDEYEQALMEYENEQGLEAREWYEDQHV